MSSKYPYIPREYYAPVMFACKMIRQNGYFNRAVSTAAKYYNVDADEVANHVRARQAAGQQETAKGRKYHYYVVAKVYQQNGDDRRVSEFSIEKATSSQNATNKYSEADSKEEYRYSESAGGVIYHAVAIDKAYDTQDDAYLALAKLRSELKEKGKSGKFHKDGSFVIFGDD